MHLYSEHVWWLRSSNIFAISTNMLDCGHAGLTRFSWSCMQTKTAPSIFFLRHEAVMGQPRDLTDYTGWAWHREALRKDWWCKVMISYVICHTRLIDKPLAKESGSTSTDFSCLHGYTIQRPLHSKCAPSRLWSAHSVSGKVPTQWKESKLNDLEMNAYGFPYHATRQESWLWIWEALSKLQSWSCLASSSWLPSFHFWCIHSGTLQVPFFFLSHKRRSLAFKAAFAFLSLDKSRFVNRLWVWP